MSNHGIMINHDCCWRWFCKFIFVYINVDKTTQKWKDFKKFQIVESEIAADNDVKVYYPSLEEFQNMKNYIRFLESDSLNDNGICKVSVFGFL